MLNVHLFSLFVPSNSVGIIWSVNPEVESLGLNMARAFISLNESMVSGGKRTSDTGLGFQSAMAALGFLTDVYAIAGLSNNVDDQQQLTIDLLRSEFTRAFPEAHADEVFVQEGFECAHDSVIKASSTAYSSYLIHF